MNMTPSEKARETRQRHKEARERKEAENKEIKLKLKNSLLSIVDSEEAKPAEKLEASKLLIGLM